MRLVGDIYCELEEIYDELIDDHNMQMGDMLYWLWGHLKIHRQDCIERYMDDGSSPIFKYGPDIDKKGVKKSLLELLKKWENSKLDSKCADEIMSFFDKEYKL